MTQSLTTLWSSRIENKKEDGASKRTDFSKTGRTPLPSSNFPLCPLTILVGGILTSSTDFSWQEFRFMQIVFCDHLQLYYASQNQSKVTSMLKVSWDKRSSPLCFLCFPLFLPLTCIFGQNSNMDQETVLPFFSVLWMMQRKLHHAGDKSNKRESWRTLAVGWRLSKGTCEGFYTVDTVVTDRRALGEVGLYFPVTFLTPDFHLERMRYSHV